MNVILVAGAALLAPASGDDEAFFEAKIRPVLVESCFKCHGGDKTSNGLRVDSRAALLRGGETAPAVVPGSPDKSLLLRAIRHADDSLRMPPGKKLPEHVAADFARWIERGAAWPAKATAGFEAKKHWGFQPVQRHQAPADPTGWAATPIDRFVMAKLREQELTPVGPAERRTLLRRATFDLIGLPPSPEEVDAFVGDQSPGAFAKVVDRLLASPHYGERWGRHWMDVVRYADTAGDNADYPIPEIYRYRDYIIDSFNKDKPFDQFVREQVAGDILATTKPAPSASAGSAGSFEPIIATGFLALSRRYATAPYEFWHLSLEDAIDTTGAAFLGLTMRCARCHDHKFDPITREDYYGLYGIFASTKFPYAGSEEFASMNLPRQAFVPLTPDGGKRMEAFRERQKQLAELLKAEKDPGKQNALKNEQKLLHRLGVPTDVPAAYAVTDGPPVETRMQLQGDPAKPGAVVPRRVPKFIEGSPTAFPSDSSGRLQLAEWLTRPDNPLTARVLVNRVWQYHFGRGIVGTPNNFGVRGEPPSHPELLDYLAAEFVRGGWSIKKLHREIMLSKTYQLASTGDTKNAGKDPGNRWLWRFERRRLDAEALRDAMLLLGGKLDLKRPGPHPFPPIQNWGWTQHNPFKDVYPSNHRSVYLMTQRIQRHPFLALFDGPDTNASTEKRPSSTVPLQALFWMNHPLVKEQAEGFARRLLELPAEQRIDRAHRLAYARPASREEMDRGAQYLQQYREELVRAGAPANRVDPEAWTSYARVLLTANEFVFVD